MRIFIATPAYNSQVYSNYTESLLQTCFMLASLNIDFEIKFINNQIVTRARNMLSYLFLENTNNTHMLFIDADILWNPADVKKLIDHDLEFVIGIYPNKKYHLNNNKLHLLPSSIIHNEVNNELNNEKSLIKVKHAATGFMMIKRSALERVKHDVETYYLPDNNGKNVEIYNFFDCNVINNDYLTEDYYFSYLFNKNGGEIYADTSINLHHMGIHQYGELIN